MTKFLRDRLIENEKEETENQINFCQSIFDRLSLVHFYIAS